MTQPFLLKAEVDGVVRTHIPDYLLIADDGPVVEFRGESAGSRASVAATDPSEAPAHLQSVEPRLAPQAGEAAE